MIAKFFIQLGRVEELGSGILTTTRLMKEYAGKGKAVFIEGGTFKTTISLPDGKAIAISDPVNDTVSDTINDTINDTIKKRIITIIKLLSESPGLKINELADRLGVSEATIKRDLQKIKILVEYQGSKKTGGYFLSAYMLSKLGHEQSA